MANICCSKYAFYATDENKGELLRLYKNLAATMETPSEGNDAIEPGWLGSVAAKHGIDWNKISCRGSIEYLDDYDPDSYSFTLDSDTAWAPTDELWEAVVAQYKGVSFVYIAEEAGMGIFTNTDSEGIYFPERYLLEIFGNASTPESWYAGQDKPGCFEIREFFEDFEELADYCVRIMGNAFSTIEELQSYLSDIFDEVDCTFACVHEFTAA